ncbi:Protein of uncharacterised function (DUF554) [Raoultella terrigena]|uniref:Protein of uncharacterized function (DUF554) n=1 Tax=Raoultella terrigena TaxID=577 RepID=A0A3P8M1B0_RAOTE|nr:Protein of uncharacterised function (DUF554) [Raoultella terrigena]
MHLLGIINGEHTVVTGPFINAGAVLLGGIIGALLSQRLPERIRTAMTSIFGLASLGIGILLVIKCANLPVMVLATLLGALLGEVCNMEKGTNALVGKLQQIFSPKGKRRVAAHDSFVQSYVAIIVLFCASGTGIFGAMREGMTGDAQHSYCQSVPRLFHRYHLCLFSRHCRRGDKRPDAGYSAHPGGLRGVNYAVDDPDDDG